MNNEEIPKYKKRKNNSSKSSKRSDHKHDYYPVIMKGFLVGWIWAEKCRICGRVKAKHFSTCKELVRPEFRNRPYLCSDFFYSYEELKELYPDVEIVLEPRGYDETAVSVTISYDGENGNTIRTIDSEVTARADCKYFKEIEDE